MELKQSPECLRKMTSSCSINHSLTSEEIHELDMLLGMLEVDIGSEALSVPEKPVVGRGGVDLLTAEQFGIVKLSGATRKAEERRQIRERKRVRGLRERKKYTRKRGTVHPKKKLATQSRRQQDRWKEQPFSCYITGYGCYNVRKDVWDEYVGQYWKMYDPRDFKLVRIKKAPDGTWYGTRQKPYDIYSFNLIHKKLGPIYKGQDRMLYDIRAGVYDAVQSRVSLDRENSIQSEQVESIESSD